jgi:hypothetical protein
MRPITRHAQAGQERSHALHLPEATIGSDFMHWVESHANKLSRQGVESLGVGARCRAVQWQGYGTFRLDACTAAKGMPARTGAEVSTADIAQ